MTYDSPSKTISFNPLSVFKPGEIISVTLTDGIESLSGTPLDYGLIWSFTIEVLNGSGEFVPQTQKIDKLYYIYIYIYIYMYIKNQIKSCKIV